jgi:uncharacterized protein (TIGR00730 family)
MEHAKNDLTIEEINEHIDSHITDITKEFRDGFEFLKKYPKSVSIFGSARFSQDDEHSIQASKLAERIVKELGYAVVTGGGPGIMQAANCGATEAGGSSVGLSIKLPLEQATNTCVKDELGFSYFFTRKTMLTFAAEAFIFLPGGFGTFDELFGILTLMQTKKIPAVPIILLGKDFWKPLHTFIVDHMLTSHKAIDEKDLKRYVITDSIDNVVEIIKKAPVSEWWVAMD